MVHSAWVKHGPYRKIASVGVFHTEAVGNLGDWEE